MTGKRTRRNSGEHVVVDAVGQCMRCKHCGEEVAILLGVVDWVTGVMKAFGKAHSRCKPGDRDMLMCWLSVVVPKSKRKYIERSDS